MIAANATHDVMADGQSIPASGVAAWTIEDVADAIGAELLGGEDVDTSVPVAAASNDTRTLVPGGLFVALQGSREHGVEHAAAALAAGAAALLAGADAPADGVARAARLLPVIVGNGAALDAVEPIAGARSEATSTDGIVVLGHLARAWRRHLGLAVVGITGSQGKTSTKELLRSLLAGSRRVVASHANRNNEIGVPLTLLEAIPGDEVVICEMGMRGAGQVAYLCSIAEPDVGLVTNAGSAHLELLGTREAIVAAKAEVLAGVREGGAAVWPSFQPELAAAAQRLPERLATFGMAKDAAAGRSGAPSGSDFDAAGGRDVSLVVDVVGVRRVDGGLDVDLSVGGEARSLHAPVHGAHQALNVAAAVAVARMLPEPVAGLDFSGAVQAAGRGDVHRLDDGTVVLDDAYNANPESMRAALAELVAHDDATRRVAVLGAMAELGEAAPALHEALGADAAELPIQALVTIGGDLAHDIRSGWATVRHARATADSWSYDTVEAALADRGAWLLPGDAVLVKASNSAGLGRLARALVEGDAP